MERQVLRINPDTWTPSAAQNGILLNINGMLTIKEIQKNQFYHKVLYIAFKNLLGGDNGGGKMAHYMSVVCSTMDDSAKPTICSHQDTNYLIKVHMKRKLWFLHKYDR